MGMAGAPEDLGTVPFLSPLQPQTPRSAQPRFQKLFGLPHPRPAAPQVPGTWLTGRSLPEKGNPCLSEGGSSLSGESQDSANRGLGQGEGAHTQILAMLCLSQKPNPFRNPKISCSPPAFAEDEVSKHDTSCLGGTRGAGTCQQTPAGAMTRQGDPCDPW